MKYGCAGKRCGVGHLVQKSVCVREECGQRKENVASYATWVIDEEHDAEWRDVHLDPWSDQRQEEQHTSLMKTSLM